MATPFSAPDEAIITATVPLSKLTLSSTSASRNIPINELYDVQWLASRILHGNFHRIALQFPDELLCDSSQILWSLQATLKKEEKKDDQNKEENQELFILADTSYGNCCVDEVAADHIDADLVIHFGHACLSLTSRLPVIYVFHKLPIDIEAGSQSLAAAVEMSESTLQRKKLVLMYDVGYEHASKELRDKLQARTGRDIYLSILDKDVNFERYLADANQPSLEADQHDGNDKGQYKSIATCKNALPKGWKAGETIVLYIGPESLALTNLILRLGPSAEVISYDAVLNKTRIETGSTNKLLQRRYYAVQKARDAQTVALLIGTLGIRSYLPLLSTLREHLIKVQNKKVYTISVGKLNPAKLANFQEIDVFVLIACPENSLVEAKDVQRSREFFKPIITPFELMTAFKGREWSGNYVLDLEAVLGDIDQADAEVKDDNDANNGDEEPHFSLITGGLVSNRTWRRNKEDEKEIEKDAAGQGIVTVRANNGSLTRVMESAGGQHIASRSWRGLEPRLGMDEAAPLEMGRSGIAKGYVDGIQERQEGH